MGPNRHRQANPAGYRSGLPSLEPQKSCMSGFTADAPKVALDGVPVTRRVMCAQLDATSYDTPMGAPILLLRRLQTNNIDVM